MGDEIVVQRNPERTRESLVSAAVDLFFEQGYERTSMQQIVSRAGATKGAFYHHFQCKEELLQVIHDSFLDEELDRAKQVIATATTQADAIRGLIRELLRTIEIYQKRVTIFLRERNSLTGPTLGAVRSKRDQFEALVNGVLESGMRTGEFRRVGDPRMLTFALMGMCAWSHEWYRPSGKHTIDEIAQQFADTVLGGLCHPAEGRGREEAS